MKRLVLLFYVITLILNADIKKDISICTYINSGAERLICYDDVAKKYNLIKIDEEITNNNGNWVVNIEKSPIDDSENVTLFLEADTAVQNNYNTYTPTLILRCSEQKTEAYIVWGIYLGVNRTKVLTRMDKNRAKSRFWTISTNYKATFAPGNNIRFIKKLIKHNRLLVQTIPYGSSPVMTTFQLTGLKEAIKPLRKACHW